MCSWLASQRRKEEPPSSHTSQQNTFWDRVSNSQNYWHCLLWGALLCTVWCLTASQASIYYIPVEQLSHWLWKTKGFLDITKRSLVGRNHIFRSSAEVELHSCIHSTPHTPVCLAFSPIFLSPLPPWCFIDNKRLGWLAGLRAENVKNLAFQKQRGKYS